jgi:long-chain fatty acid transport protein
MKFRSLSCAVAVALLAASGSTVAITNDENNATLPFSFSNPGARSLAMGGAFLGSADDATAAYTNPAGLTRLGLEQQVSLELRHNRFSTQYPAGGSFRTNPFDLGGVQYRRARASDDEVAFLSWVLPRDTWALALYRHQLLNYRNAYRTGEIAFDSAQFPETFVRAYAATSDLAIVNYGLSFAYNLTDQLSLGVGISYYDFDIDTSTERYELGSTSDVANRQQQFGSDNDIGYNIGLLYRGNDQFSVGLSYRSAPKFRYRAQSTFFGLDEPLLTADRSTRFHAPDMFGIGFSWRASDRLTINLDVNRINYGNLSKQIDDAFFSGEFAELSDPLLLRQIQARNVFEQRLGGEYVFDTMRFPLSLRAGVWREQLHKLRFVGDPDSVNFEDRVGAYAESVLFSAGSAETHVSVGFGLAFPRFQLDVGYDSSDSRDTLSLSGVFRF